MLCVLAHSPKLRWSHAYLSGVHNEVVDASGPCRVNVNSTNGDVSIHKVLHKVEDSSLVWLVAGQPYPVCMSPRSVWGTWKCCEVSYHNSQLLNEATAGMGFSYFGSSTMRIQKITKTRICFQPSFETSSFNVVTHLRAQLEAPWTPHCVQKPHKASLQEVAARHVG